MAKKSFGQHFLKDASVVTAIVDAARPEDFALTVEVGPGTGVVTEAIVRRDGPPGRLVLVEADRDLIPSLRARFPNAEIVQGDAAQVDYDGICARRPGGPSLPWLLVGNLPYNAGNAIIMHALESPCPPSRMVVMVQKEVGERLLGLPGSRGLLTVAVQMYADVTRVCTVKPGAFNPPPKVDSMVVCITPRHSSTTPDPSSERRGDVIRIAKAGFANRRKQLHGNLAAAGVADADRVKAALVALGLPAVARAEELTIEQWEALVGLLSPDTSHRHSEPRSPSFRQQEES